MIQRLKLPQVSMNMTEATIVEWHKQPGDRFEAGDPLYAFETEKVTQDVVATAPGTVVELLVPVDADVQVGDVLCVLDVEQE
jgi:pyruvate/2-oxoglutarate dehydrogenase complex dihydrolipoamide acyltransferase (E2) component